MTAALSGSVFVAQACLCGTPAPQDPSPGGGTEVTANLFAVAPSSSDGSTSCARSSTLKSYSAALAANAVCKGNGTSTTSWDVACVAATGGDKVGVMPGVYSVVGGGGYMMGESGATDCSDSTGADYDPNWEEKGNAEASLANWVTFVPGVDCGGSPNISFSETTPGRLSFAISNWHLIIQGSCFNFNRTLYIFDKNCVCGRPQNLIFRGESISQKMQLYGLEVRGARNLMFKNVDYGPNVQCAANDSNATPAYFRCDPSGPYFEDWLAAFGTNSPGCTPNGTGACAGFFDAGGGAGEYVEPYIHEGAGYGLYTNVRLENFNVHDGTAKGTGGGVHPGCFFIPISSSGTPSHNLVMDGVSCERQAIGVQHGHSGVTVQNSYFGCPVQDLSQTSPQGKWDVCAGSYAVGVGCRIDLAPGCVVSNVLYRYNVFFGGSTPGLSFNPPSSSSGTFSNVRAIGNIFIGSNLQGCNLTGVSCDNNSVFGGATATGASNTTTLSCDPFVDSEQATPDDLWRETTQLDPRLSGASCGVPTLNPSTLGSDYQLNHTIDRIARSTTATRAGVDE
jgi:hypothetical protein